MTQKEMERVKRAVIRKYPIFASVALLNVPIEEDNSIKTAAVYAEKDDKGKLVLKGIKYNSDFFDNLTFEQQVFVLAHETCHIAFKHFARSLDKPEKDVQRKYEEYCSNVSDENLRKIQLLKLHKKYYNCWNIATDACINAFLQKDGLEMPEGVIDKRTGQPMKFVNIKDGLYRRAELIYDALVKKEEEKEKDKNNKTNEKDDLNNESIDNQVGGGLDDIDIDDYSGIDSHDSWGNDPTNTKEKDQEKPKQKDKETQDEKPEKSKSFLEKVKDLFGKKGKNKKQTNLDESVTDEDKDFEVLSDEASVFKDNEIERNKRDNKSLSSAFNNITEEAGCSHIKPVKPILSWKQMLIRSVEEEIQMWGYRRANRNAPNARIEDRSSDNRATTEVILDTSGSISDSLLRAFLKQLVPLFKETKIKVGCFSGQFHGFTELKTLKQVEEFKATRDGGGTNFEAAVTSFSKDNNTKRINKIVFTDGELDSISSHVQRTKVDGIIWIVFGDKMDFKPLGGRIIRVSEHDLSKMLNIIEMNYNEDNFEEDLGVGSNISIKRR